MDFFFLCVLNVLIKFNTTKSQKPILYIQTILYKREELIFIYLNSNVCVKGKAKSFQRTRDYCKSSNTKGAQNKVSFIKVIKKNNFLLLQTNV